MQIVRYKIPPEIRSSVLAIGNFDGLHAGHLFLIKEAKKLADSIKKELTILTFYPHTRSVVGNKEEKKRLLSFKKQFYLLKEYGVNYLYCMYFSDSIAKMTHEQFVDDIIINKLNASAVIVGKNFRFGQQRAGDVVFLNKYLTSKQITFRAINEVSVFGKPCSSTRIREILKAGDMPSISSLLSRPYSIDGKVLLGSKMGTNFGFPTANLHTKNIFLPRFGVYLTSVSISGENIKRAAVCNIGIRPTVCNDQKPTLETHILDFSEIIYDRIMNVEFLFFIRPEKKFNSREELVKQISMDIRIARNMKKSFTI